MGIPITHKLAGFYTSELLDHWLTQPRDTELSDMVRAELLRRGINPPNTPEEKSPFKNRSQKLANAASAVLGTFPPKVEDLRRLADALADWEMDTKP